MRRNYVQVAAVVLCVLFVTIMSKVDSVLPGNAYFVEGKYEQAISSYSEAIVVGKWTC